MEVLKSNFEESYPEIKKAILEADFIAIDTEFTGLTTSGTQFHNADDIQTRYSKIRQIVDTYTIVQFGVCTFKETDQGYIAKPFNFYIYGDDTDTIQSRRTFSCSASSLAFLRSNGFDFNKLIDQGIPFYNFVEERNTITYGNGVSVIQRHPSQLESSLNKSGKMFLEHFRRNLNEWLQNGTQKPLVVQTNNSTQRRIVYQEIQQGKYSGFLKGESRDTRNMEIHKVKAEDRLQKTPDSPLLNFRNIIEAIKESKCPVVFHNGMFDLCYTLDQFWHNLPENISDFKDLVKSMWETVVDTKYLAEFHPLLKSCFSTSVLGSLFNTVEEELRKGGHVIKLAEGFERYSSSGSPDKCHEAGYDAYMTGIIYLGFIYYIKEKEDEKLEQQKKEKNAALEDKSQISTESETDKQVDGSTDVEMVNSSEVNGKKDEGNDYKTETNKDGKRSTILDEDVQKGIAKLDKTAEDDKDEDVNESEEKEEEEEEGENEEESDGDDDDDDEEGEDSDSDDDDEEEEGEIDDDDDEPPIKLIKKSVFTEENITPYYSKVFLMRSDVPYIDLYGTETQDGNIRKNRFYLQNIPPGVTHPAIERLYPEIAPIWISWIDESSAWLTIKTFAKVDLVKTGILGIERVRPFLQGGTRYTEGVAYNISQSAANMEILTGEQWELLQKSTKAQQQKPSSVQGQESASQSSTPLQSESNISTSTEMPTKLEFDGSTTSSAQSALPTGGSSYDDLDIPIPASFQTKRKNEFEEYEMETKKQKSTE